MNYIAIFIFMLISLISFTFVGISAAQEPIPIDLPFILGWEQNIDHESGGGYYIYISTSPKDYGSRIDVRDVNVTTYQIKEFVDLEDYSSYPILEGETYYIALSAYDSDGYESERCGPIIVEIVKTRCDELVIEAEEMSHHDNGRQAGEYWKLLSNGSISESVNFPTDDTYHISIIAKGDLASGVGPEMELIIDGVTMDAVFVNTTTDETFIFDVYVPAGDHTIAIGFYNDYYDSSTGIDRNLYVDKTIVTSVSCFAVDEICDNGIDDDGDGKTDCEDKDCEGYLIEQTTCGIGVCSSVGKLICSGGTQVDTCVPGDPTEDFEDSCEDGLDNDCDGLTDCQDPDCYNYPCDCEELVIEAEDMSHHDNGRQAGEYWKLLSNGSISESVNFPTDDTYHISIVAKGDLASGVGPEMELIIDGVTMDAVFVNTTTDETFIFDVYVPAGDHTIAIGFYNDYYDSSTGIDRNLYVDQIIIILSSCQHN